MNFLALIEGHYLIGIDQINKYMRARAMSTFIEFRTRLVISYLDSISSVGWLRND